MQAGPDGMAVLEADSQEVRLQIQDLGLQANVHQTAIKVESESGDVARAAALKSLHFHIKMNSIADFYDIPELRHYATTKFQKILSTSWSCHDFPTIIREVVNSTRDKELHDILSEVVAVHIDELLELGTNIAPPEVISDFASSVLRKIVGTKGSKDMLVQKVKDLESQLQHEISAHESTRVKMKVLETGIQLLQHERSAHESTSAKMKDLETRIQRFIKLLNRTTNCRNCYRFFGCYMEQVDSLYVLRCSNCYCRHTDATS
jgi:hypothetical protein